MKKIVLIVLISSLLFVGCGSKKVNYEVGDYFSYQIGDKITIPSNWEKDTSEEYHFSAESCFFRFVTKDDVLTEKSFSCSDGEDILKLFPQTYSLDEVVQDMSEDGEISEGIVLPYHSNARGSVGWIILEDGRRVIYVQDMNGNYLIVSEESQQFENDFLYSYPESYLNYKGLTPNGYYWESGVFYSYYLKEYQSYYDETVKKQLLFYGDNNYSYTDFMEQELFYYLLDLNSNDHYVFHKMDLDNYDGYFNDRIYKTSIAPLMKLDQYASYEDFEEIYAFLTPDNLEYYPMIYNEEGMCYLNPGWLNPYYQCFPIVKAENVNAEIIDVSTIFGISQQEFYDLDYKKFRTETAIATFMEDKNGNEVLVDRQSETYWIVDQEKIIKVLVAGDNTAEVQASKYGHNVVLEVTSEYYSGEFVEKISYEQIDKIAEQGFEISKQELLNSYGDNVVLIGETKNDFYGKITIYALFMEDSYISFKYREDTTLFSVTFEIYDDSLIPSK